MCFFLSTNFYLPNDAYIGRHHQTEMKLEQLELGGRAPPRKKTFIEKDKGISALFEQFIEGQYSHNNFLDAIKYQTGLLV